MSFEEQVRPPESIEKEQVYDFTQEFDDYGYVDSFTASAQNTPQNVLDVVCNTCCDSGYEEANDDEKKSKNNLQTDPSDVNQTYLLLLKLDESEFCGTGTSSLSCPLHL
jgi:hypothetical protein